MLRADRTLSKGEIRDEVARRDRRIFQMVTSLIVLVVTFIVASFGAHRLLSAYVFVLFWLLFNEAVRRVLRRIGEANNVNESTELARVAPFCTLVSYVLAWIAASELLVGTGALSQPFGRTVSFALTAALFAMAVAATWSQNRVVHDRFAALAWMALLVPTQSSSPRTASALLTSMRVLVLLGSHFSLMARSEGRVSSTKWHEYALNSSSMAQVMSVASNNSARKLAQSAWILTAWPPAILLVVTIILLNEYVGVIVPRQSTSPPLSRSPSPRGAKPPSPPAALFVESDVERGDVVTLQEHFVRHPTYTSVAPGDLDDDDGGSAPATPERSLRAATGGLGGGAPPSTEQPDATHGATGGVGSDAPQETLAERIQRVAARSAYFSSNLDYNV